MTDDREPANDNQFQFTLWHKVLIFVGASIAGWVGIFYWNWLTSFGLWIAVPVLVLSIWLISKLKRFEFVIDFHNYGYTILRLNVKNRTIVNGAKKYEQVFGRLCGYSFCVSDAMKDDLRANWGIELFTLKSVL